jgi:hypothetical protein
MRWNKKIGAALGQCADDPISFILASRIFNMAKGDTSRCSSG